MRKKYSSEVRVWQPDTQVVIAGIRLAGQERQAGERHAAAHATEL